MAKEYSQDRPSEKPSSNRTVLFLENAASQFGLGKTVSWIQLYKNLSRILLLLEVLPTENADTANKDVFVNFMVDDKLPDYLKTDEIPHDEMDMSHVAYLIEIFLKQLAEKFPQKILKKRNISTKAVAWDPEGDRGKYFADNLSMIARSADVLIEFSLEYLREYHHDMSKIALNFSPELRQRSEVIIQAIRQRIDTLMKSGF